MKHHVEEGSIDLEENLISTSSGFSVTDQRPHPPDIGSDQSRLTRTSYHLVTMLYSRRQRLNQIAQRESAGETFWTEMLDERARGRLLHQFEFIRERGKQVTEADFYTTARKLVLVEEGLLTLVGFTTIQTDVDTCILSGGTDLVFTLVEAVSLVAQQATRSSPTLEKAANLFDEGVRTILREERVSFDFQDGQIIPKESQELHHEVVLPALTLLATDFVWSPVEAAYRAALDELHNGTPGDAITDAATALQEMLQLLGCEGNALGPLISSAQKKGLLTGYDPRLVSILEWVSADRSQKGDSHKAEGHDLSREDAWLTVHVVGALIVRLASGQQR